MIKTLKWIYKLGHDRAMARVFNILEGERDFHLSQLQAQGAKNNKFDIHKDRIVTPEHHEQRYQEAEDILNRLDPKKYPNIDNFMDMLK